MRSVADIAEIKQEKRLRRRERIELPKRRSGNRCGHNPAKPRFYAPPEEHKKRPSIIVDLIERIEQYYHSPSRLPTLAAAYFMRRQGDDCLVKKHRARRSEHREGALLLLGAILHYCDLPTMCVAVPQPGGDMIPVKMETLAKKAGISLRRAERAMRDLVTAGFLTITRRYDRDDETGDYRGRASIKQVAPLLFSLFGLGERLKSDRKAMSAKRRDEGVSTKMTRTGAARLKSVMNVMLGNKRKPEPSLPPPPPNKPLEQLDAAREILGMATTVINDAAATPEAPPAPEPPVPTENDKKSIRAVFSSMFSGASRNKHDEGKRAESLKRAKREAGDMGPRPKRKHDPP